MSNRIITGSECPQGLSDVLESTVGYAALLSGFSSIEYAALRVLSNLILSFMEDIGVKGLSYAESAGRNKLTPLDLMLAFADSGINILNVANVTRRRQYKGFKEPASITDYGKQGVVQAAILGPTGATIIPRPLGLRTGQGSGVGSTAGTMSSLNSGQTSTALASGHQSGSAQSSGLGSSHSISTPSGTAAALLSSGTSALTNSALARLPVFPSNITLPGAPESHSFLDTRVCRPPHAPDLAVLRRRAAEQLRRVQLSLVHFLAKIKPVHQLFPDDPDSVPILLPAVSPRPYLAALLVDSERSDSEAVQNQLLRHTHHETKSYASSERVSELTSPSSSSRELLKRRASEAALNQSDDGNTSMQHLQLDEINPYLKKPKFSNI